MGQKRIGVLVVEDSFLMRKIISDIINSDPELEVIDSAKNGQEAIEKILLRKPDVVTLDIELPVLDGIGVLKEIMQKQPTRVVMLSAYTREGTSATIKALELGAIDFIAKPSGKISLDLPDIREYIVSKIKLAAKVSLEKFAPSRAKVVPKEKREIKAPSLIKKLVIIGASTGGPKIVIEIMQGIPADLPATFLIVQHMPRGFTASLAERISWESEVKAKEAEDGDVILPGKAYVAAAEHHMVLEKSKGRLMIKLTKDEMVNFVRPSVDVTMLSAVEAFGDGIIGVILSGMGKDGLEGARKIKENGGFIIAQDEATSIVWGMPKAVYDAGLADKVLPLSKIREAIIESIDEGI